MKAGHDIAIDRRRSKTPAGGDMAALDPVAQGRVQVLECPPGDVAQAMAAVDELVRLSHLDPEWSWSRAAIIAREWRRLAPVRAYAETLGIPVEMANESLPSIWRLREMQQFIDVLRLDATRLLGIRDLVDVLNAIPSNRWTDLIAEGIAALAKELANKTMSVPDLVEWFAEWANDARSDQRALLLLTAHRSKGVEFDDVVILNGGWDRPSKGEDPDAPRRLFYVAMTRARRSLAIIAERNHPFVPQGAEYLLRRTVPTVTEAVALPTALYEVPDLTTVDLSWAGSSPAASSLLGRHLGRKCGGPDPHRARWPNLDDAGCAGTSARTHGQKLVASPRPQLGSRRGRRHRALAQVRQFGRVPGAPSTRCMGGGCAGATIRLIGCPLSSADQPGIQR